MFSGWMVPVEADDVVEHEFRHTDHVLVKSMRLWQESVLADDWVADVELASPGDGEEAVAGASEVDLVTVFGAREERPEVLVTGGASSTDDEEHPPATIDDGEGRLAAVVSEHEVGRGGGAAPRRADRAAGADVPGWQADEYVVDDLLRQVLEHGGAAPVRHGRVRSTDRKIEAAAFKL